MVEIESSTSGTPGDLQSTAKPGYSISYDLMIFSIYSMGQKI
jgi:hypothetical protein